MRLLPVLFSALLLAAVSLPAADSEFALLAGAISAPSRTANSSALLTIGNGAAIEGNWARRLSSLKVKYAEVLGEVNVLVGPWQSISTTAAGVTPHYTALYLTPGIRVKFYPTKRLSPWAAAGGGYALYVASGAASHNTNSGAVDFGGGMDFLATPHLIIRGEVRDFYTASPNFSVPVHGMGQYNFVAGGGIVWKLGR